MTITEDTGLTSADIRTLKSCDNIVFRHSHGNSTLEGTRRDNPGEPKNNHVVTVRSRFNQYGEQPGDDMGDPHEEAACFCFVGNYEDSVIRTLLLTMKPGDEVVLVWNRDVNNGYVNDAIMKGEMENRVSSRGERLHVDSLEIELRRVVRGKKVRLKYSVDHQCCTDNTARMIRRS